MFVLVLPVLAQSPNHCSDLWVTVVSLEIRPVVSVDCIPIGAPSCGDTLRRNFLITLGVP